MARIWYGVGGEGYGHAVRSDSILERLTKKHDVLITAAEKSYKYLKRRYKNVHYIWGNTLVYKDNRQMSARSFLKFLLESPYKIPTNYFRLKGVVNRFKPQLIISDFESATHYAARIKKIPCISLDNIHFETETEYDCDRKIPGYLNATVKFLHPSSDYYIITAFSDLKAKVPEKTFFVPPIIRSSVQKKIPKKGEHVLVYQTSSTNTKMLKELRKHKREFRIYGMKEKSKGNLYFKKFDEQRFIEDLRTCRYAIINGGFTTLSEALYLKKPILAIPIIDQYEQYFNAYSIEKKGFGKKVESIDTDVLEKFEKNISKYVRNIKKIRWDHDMVFRIIDKILRKEKIYN